MFWGNSLNDSIPQTQEEAANDCSLTAFSRDCRFCVWAISGAAQHVSICQKSLFHKIISHNVYICQYPEVTFFKMRPGWTFGLDFGLFMAICSISLIFYEVSGNFVLLFF